MKDSKVRLADAQKPTISRRLKPSVKIKDMNEKETIWTIVKKNVKMNRNPKNNSFTGIEILACPNVRSSNSSTNEPNSLWDNISVLQEDNDGDDILWSLLGNSSGSSNEMKLINEIDTDTPSISIASDGSLILENNFSQKSTSADMWDNEGRQFVQEDGGSSAYVKPYEGAYKKTVARRWTEPEEKRFYWAIAKCGGDLMLVHSLLPQFTEKQILSKFKIEEKRNPEAINKALQMGFTLTIEDYEAVHGKIESSFLEV